MNKFINVFGQWVHPDFKLVPQLTYDGKDIQVALMWVKQQNLFDNAFIVFNNKTIGEVAEEYNRQVELSHNRKNVNLIKKDSIYILYVDGAEYWEIDDGTESGFIELLNALGFAVTVSHKVSMPFGDGA